MGSPLGPLMANAFMCNIEKQVETENEMPAFYKRYVDDTFSAMPDFETASEFLTTLNNSHPSIDFTMELDENGRLPFLGMNIIRNGCRLDTKVYRKPTDTGLLLHHHSHVDSRYKRSLLNTMLNRTFKLSSTWKHFDQECERSAQTTWRPQSEYQCGYQPGVHKSEDQGWNKSEGRQATPCKSTMRCVSFSVWPVRCRLYRLHVPTPSPANWGT